MKKTLPIIHKCIIYLILLQTLIFKWLINKDISSYISLFLFSFIIIVVIKKRILKINDFIVIMLFFMVVIINLFVNGLKPRFIESFYSQTVANLIIIIYILCVKNMYKEGLKNFILNDLFVFLNTYFLINVPILIKQLNYSYFMMRYIQNNPMYQDHITGLIGASGTHNLLMFWILLTIVNLFKLYEFNKLRYKILIIFEIIFMVFISNKNDNTAFYIFFILIILQYISKEILKFKLKNIFKCLISIISIVMICLTLYNTNASFKEFCDTRIYSKLVAYGVINDQTKSYNSQGDERIMLYNMALERGNGYGLGMGIGSIKSYGDTSLNEHFGMSEISLRVYEGGIIYFVSLIFIFTYFLYRICDFKKSKLKVIGSMFILLDIVLFSVYTIVFRTSIFSISLSIISCMISYKYNEANINCVQRQDNK